MARKRKLRIAQPQPAQTKASPQDQAMYNRVMLIARKNIYGDPNDDSRFKMVLQRLSNSKGEVGQAIGQLTATIIANIQGAIGKQGKTVPGYILFHAGREIIADLVQIATAAKLITPAQAKTATQQAITAAVPAYKQAQATIAAMPQQQATPAPAPVAPTAPAASAAPMQPPPQAPPGLVNAARGA